MTVKELIEKLQSLPNHENQVVLDDLSGGIYQVKGVDDKAAVSTVHILFDSDGGDDDDSGEEG